MVFAVRRQEPCLQSHMTWHVTTGHLSSFNLPNQKLLCSFFKSIISVPRFLNNLDSCVILKQCLQSNNMLCPKLWFFAIRKPYINQIVSDCTCIFFFSKMQERCCGCVLIIYSSSKTLSFKAKEFSASPWNIVEDMTQSSETYLDKYFPGLL